MSEVGPVNGADVEKLYQYIYLYISDEVKWPSA
jgi:hypothetical protein